MERSRCTPKETSFKLCSRFLSKLKEEEGKKKRSSETWQKKTFLLNSQLLGFWDDFPGKHLVREVFLSIFAKSCFFRIYSSPKHLAPGDSDLLCTVESFFQASSRGGETLQDWGLVVFFAQFSPLPTTVSLTMHMRRTPEGLTKTQYITVKPAPREDRGRVT